MDQFSHDLAAALQETSLLDRAHVSRWGHRRRTRSTGNLPCAPQPTEDSSSPTDINSTTNQTSNIFDGLDTHKGEDIIHSDSDEKEENPILRLPRKPFASTVRLGTLESDSLNETTFSPSRFFKPNARRKRKLKRIAMEYEYGEAQTVITENTKSVPNSQICGGSMRKRCLKVDSNSRTNLLFSGKRKRSNRDRYNEQDFGIKCHSSSMPRHCGFDEYRMRPRSFSSTTLKPNSDRLLPLNKGLLSRIEKISQQQQKTDSQIPLACNISQPIKISETNPVKVNLEIGESINTKSRERRRKSSHSLRKSELDHLQFRVDNQSMDCSELNDFLSSSSLSSSESEIQNAANDTDREGDDELTDWPGNETSGGPLDPKRKLTKKSTLPQIKSGETLDPMLLEDDTIMSGSVKETSPKSDSGENLETQFPSSTPISIKNLNITCRRMNDAQADMGAAIRQIESEMSGEASNPCLSSPPFFKSEVREIRAGCRRIKCERPGFSIKTSVNERLARFLQDPRQVQIRLPEIEVYEHDNLNNLANLYSLSMSLENGCAVLNKTSNTTQSVNIEQQNLQGNFLLSDFKRRCCDEKDRLLPGN